MNAGAGSHASYFVAGEYMTEQELALAAPLRAIASAWSRLAGTQRSSEKILPIAFVDYARGDGVAIGPGLEHTWDAAAGRRGALGPGVRRAVGSARQGPVRGRGRAGRTDVLARRQPPRLMARPARLRRPRLGAAAIARARGAARAADRHREAASGPRATIASLIGRVASLGAEDRAVLASGRRQSTREADADDATDVAERAAIDELAAARRAQATDEMRKAAIETRLAAIERGEVDPPGAHLGRYAVPTKAEDRRFGRFLEIWAALSIGLLLLGLVFVALVLPQLVVVAAIAVIAAFLFLDSVLRGTVAGVASTITLTLAGLVLLILVITFWAQALVVVAVAAAGFVIWQNLSEMR